MLDFGALEAATLYDDGYTQDSEASLTGIDQG